jgi:hypothetical protein
LFNIKKIRMALCYVFAAILLMLMLLTSSAYSGMVGPFSGQVSDSRTGEPIQEASVLIYWVKRVPVPPSGAYSELIKITLVYTDDHGIYKIPRQFLNVGLVGWLESTNLIIYQPGYQVSIDRKWQGDLPAPLKTAAIIKLERIPPSFDYKKHHEQITDALRGLDIDYNEGVDNITGRRLSTKEIVERVAIMAEYWEFMRRIEWEKE